MIFTKKILTVGMIASAMAGTAHAEMIWECPGYINCDTSKLQGCRMPGNDFSYFYPADFTGKFTAGKYTKKSVQITKKTALCSYVRGGATVNFRGTNWYTFAPYGENWRSSEKGVFTCDYWSTEDANCWMVVSP